MTSSRRRVGTILRLLASGGYAEEDTEVVSEVVQAARDLAAKVLSDPGSSQETRDAARELLEEVDADTFE
ncbi:MAG: hypothetical protein JOZ75_01675 [Candidatus Dormibacteraeota bacterium]|nr:hypothetical protein [Candidatus Dormibacteraeota bacterium]